MNTKQHIILWNVLTKLLRNSECRWGILARTEKLPFSEGREKGVSIELSTWASPYRFHPSMLPVAYNAPPPYLPLGEWTQGVQVLCAGKTSQNNVDHLGEQAGEQKVAFLHPPIVYWIFHTKFLESWRDNICWLLCLSSISGYFKYCLITYNSPPMVS